MYNSRMKDLLETLKIEGHFYSDGQEVELSNIHDIDYEVINMRLNKLRTVSEKYIKENILR